jgi:hypothetical protein
MVIELHGGKYREISSHVISGICLDVFESHALTVGKQSRRGIQRCWPLSSQ